MNSTSAPNAQPTHDATAFFSSDAAWFDAHLDLAYLAELGRDLTRPIGVGGSHCATLPDLAEAPVECCLATIFCEPGLDDPSQPWGYRDSDDRVAARRAAVRQLDRYLALEACGAIEVLRWREDLDTPGSGRMRIAILVEGADGIDGGEDLAWWFDRGVRVLGLAWARGTRAAGGNAAPRGLSGEGRDLVAAADALGVLHDASHLADAAFADLLARSDRRVIASHSNARWLMGSGENQRHLTRDQVAEIARREGAVGLNLYGRFLAEDRSATLEDCLRHVEAIAEIAGRERVGLGSDLDGGFGTAELPEGLRHPAQFPALDHGLAARGWSHEERRGFRCGNWFRVLRESLPPRPPHR